MVEEVARQVKRFRGPSGPLGGVTIAPGCPMKNNFVFAIIGAIVIASTLSVWDGLKAGPYGEPGQKAVAAEDAGPLVQVCTDKSTPACAAVRGDRSEGWLQQTRSEVMARNGIVTTVQPLAAQAGLRILQEGGNAIDAAVASAAMLNVVYPANTGIGGDLFAMIYVAKEKKVYQLNASGIMPSGATLAHMNELGYKADPKNGGPVPACQTVAFSR